MSVCHNQVISVCIQCASGYQHTGLMEPPYPDQQDVITDRGWCNDVLNENDIVRRSKVGLWQIDPWKVVSERLWKLRVLVYKRVSVRHPQGFIPLYPC